MTVTISDNVQYLFEEMMVRGYDGFRRFSLFLERHLKFEEMMIRGNDGFPPRGAASQKMMVFRSARPPPKEIKLKNV